MNTNQRRSARGGRLALAGIAWLGTACTAGSAEPPSDTSALSELQAYVPEGMECGFYWFGPGNVAKKATPGEPNPHYDPSRPTLLYSHGWHSGSAVSGYRESFNYAQNDSRFGADIDMGDAWLEDGWNIGAFVWTPLADESDVNDAEAKIWTTQATLGMRWRTPDGRYVVGDVPDKAVAELFVDAYVAAMKGQKNGAIRFAGHSLGNQVVTLAAKLVSDLVDAGRLPEVLRPKRVALLDPFWTPSAKDFLDGRTPGEVAFEATLSLIERGVLFERYTTSNFNDLAIGDANEALTKVIGDTRMLPEFIPLFEQSSRHTAAPNLYFHSYAFAPPPACTAALGGARRCDGRAPSAATSDEDTRVNMESPFRWVQTAGAETEAPGDNVFELLPR
jgi:hypothetical protein